jgi:FkbM family methyltransferase
VWWLTWDDVVSEALRLSGFEAAEQKFLQDFLQPGMTVLDIGAHYGLYTLLASKRVGNRGSVIAFEPSPRERKKLHRHIRFNRCSNVRVEPFALGSTEGIAKLFVCLDRHTAFNSLRPPAVSAPTNTIDVCIITLDNYLRFSSIVSADCRFKRVN